MRGNPTAKITYSHYDDHHSRSCEKPVVRETAWRLYLNGQELVTMLCTPNKMNFLVVGFLASEGIMRSLDDVALLRVCEDEGNIIDVRLNKEGVALPQPRVLLSGCGGAVTFDDVAATHPPLHSSLRIRTGQLSTLMRDLYQRAEVYYTRQQEAPTPHP